MALIAPTLTYDGFEQVDIVVEAVFENMDLKKATFAELGKVTRPDCMLASNTSTLDIDEFAQASGRPAQVIGHHFFSPANVMKLLEIVRGRETSKEIIATSMKLAKRLGKVGVRGRQLLRLRRQPDAGVLHARGLPAARRRRERRSRSISALTEFGMPVGPFAMQDIAGIDVGARIRQYLRRGQDARRRSAVARARLAVRDGPLRPEDRRRLVSLRSAGSRSRIPIRWSRNWRGSRGGARHHAAQRSPTTRSSRASWWRWPTKARTCSRKARRTRAGDIDVIYVNGFGFPRHRGGP